MLKKGDFTRIEQTTGSIEMDGSTILMIIIKGSNPTPDFKQII